LPFANGFRVTINNANKNVFFVTIHWISAPITIKNLGVFGKKGPLRSRKTPLIVDPDSGRIQATIDTKEFKNPVVIMGEISSPIPLNFSFFGFDLGLVAYYTNDDQKPLIGPASTTYMIYEEGIYI
jgi:hypothetical protein